MLTKEMPEYPMGQWQDTEQTQGLKRSSFSSEQVQHLSYNRCFLFDICGQVPTALVSAAAKLKGKKYILDERNEEQENHCKEHAQSACTCFGTSAESRKIQLTSTK